MSKIEDESKSPEPGSPWLIKIEGHEIEVPSNAEVEKIAGALEEAVQWVDDRLVSDIELCIVSCDKNNPSGAGKIKALESMLGLGGITDKGADKGVFEAFTEEIKNVSENQALDDEQKKDALIEIAERIDKKVSVIRDKMNSIVSGVFNIDGNQPEDLNADESEQILGAASGKNRGEKIRPDKVLDEDEAEAFSADQQAELLGNPAVKDEVDKEENEISNAESGNEITPVLTMADDGGAEAKLNFKEEAIETKISLPEDGDTDQWLTDHWLFKLPQASDEEAPLPVETEPKTYKNFSDIIDLSKTYKYDADGNMTNEQDFARDGAKITLSKIHKFSDLNIKDPKILNNVFKMRTRKMWRDLAVHGVFGRKNGKPGLLEYGDLDGKSALALLERGGIDTSRIKYIEPGEQKEGFINIDTGNQYGLVQVMDENGQITVYLDHHGGAGNDTSAAMITYKTLTELGLLAKDENLDKAVEFVTQMDNKTFPDAGEYFEDSYRNMLGLARFVEFEKLVEFFKDGKKPTDSLTEVELKKYGFSNGKKNRSEEVRNSIKKSFEVIEELEKSGFIVESEKFGKIVVDIDGKIPAGFDAVVNKGFDTYVNWSSSGAGFFITSKKIFPDDFKLQDGVKPRNTMLLKSRLDKTPLKTNIADVLRALFGADFKFEGGLKELVDKSDEYEKDISTGLDAVLDKYLDLGERKKVLELFLRKVDGKTEDGFLLQSEILMELQKIEDKEDVDKRISLIGRKAAKLPDDLKSKYLAKADAVSSKAEAGLISGSNVLKKLDLIIKEMNDLKKSADSEPGTGDGAVAEPVGGNGGEGHASAPELEKRRDELMDKIRNGEKLTDEEKEEKTGLNKKINELRWLKIRKDEISAEIAGADEGRKAELEAENVIIDKRVDEILHGEAEKKDGPDDGGDGGEKEAKDVLKELGLDISVNDFKAELDCIAEKASVIITKESHAEIENLITASGAALSREERDNLFNEMEVSLNAALDAEAEREFTKLKYHKKVLAAGIGIGAIAGLVSAGARMMGAGMLADAGKVAAGVVAGGSAGYIRAKTREWLNPTIQKIRKENRIKLEEIRQKKKAEILNSGNLKLVAVQKIKDAILRKVSKSDDAESDYVASISAFLDANDGGWKSLEDKEKQELIRSLAVLAEVSDENNKRLSKAVGSKIDGRMSDVKKSMIIGASIGGAANFAQTFSESPYAPAIVAGAISGFAMSGAIEAKMAEHSSRKKEIAIIDRINKAESGEIEMESEELKSYLEGDTLNKYPLVREKAKNILMDRLLNGAEDLNRDKISKLNEDVRKEFERKAWQKAGSYAIGIGAGIATGTAGRFIYELLIGDENIEKFVPSGKNDSLIAVEEKVLNNLDKMSSEDREYIAKHGLDEYLVKNQNEELFKNIAPKDSESVQENQSGISDAGVAEEDAVSKSDKLDAGAKPLDAGEKTKEVNDGAISAKVEELNKQLDIATIRKGEGIEHALIRQLNANPKKFHYDPASGLKQKTWAELEAHRLAIKAGYVDIDTGKQIWVRAKGIGNAAYLIRHDTAGNLEVSEHFKSDKGIFGLQESHDVGVKSENGFEDGAKENYEYVGEKSEPAIHSSEADIPQAQARPEPSTAPQEVEHATSEEIKTAQADVAAREVDAELPEMKEVNAEEGAGEIVDTTFNINQLKMLGINFDDGASKDEVYLLEWAEAEKGKVEEFLEKMEKGGYENPFANFNAVRDIADIDKQLAILELFQRQDAGALSRLFKGTEIIKSGKFSEVVTFHDQDGNLVLNYNGRGMMNKLFGSRDFQMIIHQDGKTFINGPALWNKEFASLKNIKEVLEWPLEALKETNSESKLNIKE